MHGVDTLIKSDDKDKTNDNDCIDDRTLIEGLLKPKEVIRLGFTLYITGIIAFLILTTFSPAKEPYLAIIFFGALPLSFLYTGGIGNYLFIFLYYHCFEECDYYLTHYSPIEKLFSIDRY